MDAPDHSPDFVVVSEGRTVTLDALERPVNMILRGVQMRYRTVFTLTGGTSRDDVKHYA